MSSQFKLTDSTEFDRGHVNCVDRVRVWNFDLHEHVSRCAKCKPGPYFLLVDSSVDNACYGVCYGLVEHPRWHSLITGDFAPVLIGEPKSVQCTDMSNSGGSALDPLSKPARFRNRPKFADTLLYHPSAFLCTQVKRNQQTQLSLVQMTNGVRLTYVASYTASFVECHTADGSLKMTCQKVSRIGKCTETSICDPEAYMKTRTNCYHHKIQVRVCMPFLPVFIFVCSV